MEYDFSGWATRNDLKCSDGRTIRKDAFKHCDGETVPLVWSHNHKDIDAVLGHALLENREEGVYAYGTFNDSESGQTAKLLVQHGDIAHLSIFANQLKHQGSNVMHGKIREVSLVLAGANPGAFIDSVIKHGEESEEEGIIYTDESISLYHADESEEKESEEETNPEKKEEKSVEEKTLKEIYDDMTEEQKTVVHAMVGAALEEGEIDESESEEGDDDMKHNLFDKETETNGSVLSHADQEAIIGMAKTSSVGSLQEAISIYAEENGALAHGFENYEALFPEYECRGFASALSAESELARLTLELQNSKR